MSNACGDDAEVVTRTRSYKLNRFDGEETDKMLSTDPDTGHLFPVKVFDPKGKLKRIISVEEIASRPMEEGIL